MVYFGVIHKFRRFLPENLSYFLEGEACISGESIMRNIYRVRGLTASFVLAVAVYATLRYFLPQGGQLMSELRQLASVFAIIPLSVPVVAFLADSYRRQRWAQSSSLQSLREMPYMDFRLLIAEALRREGYSVEEKTGLEADQDIDLVLYKDKNRIAGLCRHRESNEVDSFQVQELYESMLRDGADVALFITVGSFTEEAQRLARNKPLVLADGKALLELVKAVRNDSQFESARYLRRASLEPTY